MISAWAPAHLLTLGRTRAVFCSAGETGDDVRRRGFAAHVRDKRGRAHQRQSISAVRSGYDPWMTDVARRLLEDVLALPEDERAHIATELIVSYVSASR